MSEYKAELFYGYQISLTQENEEKIREMADSTGLSITYLSPSSNKAILGKKLESSREEEMTNITSENFLKSIRSIKLGPELKRLEDKLNLQEVEPKLVLCTINYDE